MAFSPGQCLAGCNQPSQRSSKHPREALQRPSYPQENFSNKHGIRGKGHTTFHFACGVLGRLGWGTILHSPPPPSLASSHSAFTGGSWKASPPQHYYWEGGKASLSHLIVGKGLSSHPKDSVKCSHRPRCTNTLRENYTVSQH